MLTYNQFINESQSNLQLKTFKIQKVKNVDDYLNDNDDILQESDIILISEKDYNKDVFSLAKSLADIYHGKHIFVIMYSNSFNLDDYPFGKNALSSGVSIMYNTKLF